MSLLTSVSKLVIQEGRQALRDMLGRFHGKQTYFPSLFHTTKVIGEVTFIHNFAYKSIHLGRKRRRFQINYPGNKFLSLLGILSLCILIIGMSHGQRYGLKLF